MTWSSCELLVTGGHVKQMFKGHVMPIKRAVTKVYVNFVQAHGLAGEIVVLYFKH